MRKHVNRIIGLALFVLCGLVALTLFASGRDSPEKASILSMPTAELSVLYRVTGTAKEASLTYIRSEGAQEQDDSYLPTAKRVRGPKPGMFVYISAQNMDDFGSVTCEIEVNGETWRNATTHSAYGIATCSGTLPPTR